jgi:ATP-dependent RNA helicase MSS116
VKVVQVSAPTDREQYTHRLGRTARAGKKGDGLLFLADYEERLLDTPLLNGLPLQLDTEQKLKPGVSAAFGVAVGQAVQMLDASTTAKAYQAWLGYHNSSCGYDHTYYTMITLGLHCRSILITLHES